MPVLIDGDGFMTYFAKGAQPQAVPATAVEKPADPSLAAVPVLGKPVTLTAPKLTFCARKA